jgi:hypothetical protein
VIRDPSDGSVKEINPAPNENKKVGVKTPSEGITVESIRIIKHTAAPVISDSALTAARASISTGTTTQAGDPSPTD